MGFIKLVAWPAWRHQLHVIDDDQYRFTPLLFAMIRLFLDPALFSLIEPYGIIISWAYKVYVRYIFRIDYGRKLVLQLKYIYLFILIIYPICFFFLFFFYVVLHRV